MSNPLRVRCKMKVQEVVRTERWDKPGAEMATIRANVVTGGSDENKRFFASTPGGRMEINAIDDATLPFKPGQEVYVEIIAIEAPPLDVPA